MSKKLNFITGCLNAVEQLRVDVETGQLTLYDVKDVPAGIIPRGYLAKCTSVAVAVSGSGNNDYLVLMPTRPDRAASGSGKVIDIDPVVFCLKSNSLDTYPTGVALFHQNYGGRTSPISGYDTYTLEQTVNDMRTNLLTGSKPLSAAPNYYLNSISHSVARLNDMFGSQISGWNKPTVIEIPASPPDSGSKPGG